MTTYRRGMLAALSFLGVAVLLFGAALARALTVEPVTPEPQASAPAAPTDGPVSTDEPSVPSEAVLSSQDIALAVDRDPFLPDRARPEPYRLPGEDVVTMPETPAAAPVPGFQLRGTVVAGDAGLAVLQVDETPPLVLAVGESLLGFRLDAVAPTTATLMRGEQTLYLSLATPEPQRAQGSDRGRNSSIQLNPALIQSLQQRFGDGFGAVLERLQASGDQAQAQAMLERLMGQQGGRGRTVFRVQRDTTDVPLRTPDQP